MKQKLIVAAVAGAFLAPGAVLAQVTISGDISVGLQNSKIGNAANAGVRVVGTAPVNKSAMEMVTDVKIRFVMSEDLGGGNTFTGQYEFRPILDGATGSADALQVGSSTPPGWVGIRNLKGWGGLRMGTINTWAGKGGGDLPQGFAYTPTRLMDYAATATTTGGQSFGAGRVRNVIYYEAPRVMGPFVVDLAYSTAPLGDDADLTVATRKGSGWWLMPSFDAGFGVFSWTHQDVKEEATTRKHTADKLAFVWNGGGFNVAPQYVRFKATDSALAVSDQSRQKKWMIPVTYRTGPHTIGVAYAKTAQDKAAAAAGLDLTAKWKGIAYNYNFSKRTAISLDYVKLTNGRSAGYDLASNTGTASGSIGFTALAGESATVISAALHHNF